MAQNLFVYRPLLNLIGKAEGTDRGRGYNETLGYGRFTGGDVPLTNMTLDEVDQLQTRMLGNPKNTFNSSAVGRYQIVRTTLRRLKRQLGLPNSMFYDATTQDILAARLLEKCGVEDFLAGGNTDVFINNLAREWASFPTTEGKGYYSGQRAAITLDEVHTALQSVRDRYASRPRSKPLYRSRTMVGQGAAVGGAGGAVVADKVGESAAPVQTVPEAAGEAIRDASDSLFGLAQVSQIVMWVFIALAIAGVALTIYARIDDRNKGVR